MITETLKSVEIQPKTEQSSPAILVESNISDVFKPVPVFDKTVTLIIDNSGKILLVQSVRQNSEEAGWGIPMNNIYETESPAESAVRGLKETAGFIMVPNHLLPLGFIIAETDGSDSKIHLFLHKTSQVQYSPNYTSTLTDNRTVKWLHKIRLVESIRTKEITDFGTVSLFEKAVLLGII